MRSTLLALVLVAAPACSGVDRPPDPVWPASASLSRDLFPLRESSAPFVDQRAGGVRTLRVLPAADGAGARVVLDVPGSAPREIRVLRRGDSVFFSSGPDTETELLRGGARPGDRWESGGSSVRFEGWETVAVSGASYDAARVTTRRGPAEFEFVETWWFAKDVGLVRVRSDHGSMFVDDLVRTSP